ncbi:MAG TPA: toast rack family protein [Candidatus Marinimicrobia bacterium]|nr:toast rack family protein [Candidatus Neomarinimicrobiota bacterium]HRS50866.1 toast rack family protein [Candidatus Neomarinimicrobiota bacterium]HRU91792.1 toast rack family protein [Candidatus Neomarinimicrobiota bacterium]
MKVKIIIYWLLLTAVLTAEEYRTDRYDIPYKGEEELDVNISFGLGTLNLKSHDDPKYLVHSIMTYSQMIYKPNVDYKILGNRGRLKMSTEKYNESDAIDIKKRKPSRADKELNKWFLEFSRKIPIYFSLDLGLGEGRLDFTDLRVRDLKLQCGLSDVNVVFRNQNQDEMRNLVIATGLGSVDVRGLGYANMERFNVECGLGTTELVFDGGLKQDIRGKIEVGLGSVIIEVPDDIAVEVRSQSSFLSSLNLRGFDRIGENLYRSGNWQTAKKRIYLEIDVGLGSVDINWLD